MVINRIIDSVALAIAGVTADPVVRAQAQALAQHSVLLTTYPTNGGDESDVRVDHLDVALAQALHLVGLWPRKPDPVEPRGYAVQQVWSAVDPKVSESAKTV